MLVVFQYPVNVLPPDELIVAPASELYVSHPCSPPSSKSNSLSKNHSSDVYCLVYNLNPVILSSNKGWPLPSGID